MRYFQRENKYLEGKIDSFFEYLTNVNNKFYENKLSVVLLGSLSRGEATWYRDAKGKDVMLSDIEFFTIYTDDFKDFFGFTKHIQCAIENVFGKDMSSLFHVDNSYIKKSQICLLDRKLLTYDCTVFGKCVVGQDVMHLFPNINIDNINLYDIEDIIAHRLFSVLYYGLPLKNNGLEDEYRYSLAKNSLDLMTVILVSNGILESGFLRRLEKILDLDFPEKYKNYFRYCLAIKFNEACKEEYSIEEMEMYFETLISKYCMHLKIPVRNILLNKRAIVRRRLGILKRMIKYHGFVYSRRKHSKKLLQTFCERRFLTEKEKKNNLILHGYPVN